MLAVVTLVGFVPVTSFAAPGAIRVTTAEELITVFGTGGEAVLDADITLSTPLAVASGTAVTLDLNGKTIDRGLTEETAGLNGYVIRVEGSLTLDDSQGSGKITGGRKSGYTGGGGVYVSGGALTMNSGSISGNASADGGGGGVYVYNGAFTMNGGAISGNGTAGGGGGVHLEGGQFTMNGGSISGNTAKQSGGVFVNEGTFNMNGGTISSNTAAGTDAASGYGGGVSVLYGGSFIMNDGDILGNTAEGWSTIQSMGGGVCVNMSGSFTMNGGTISQNEAEQGGGVYLQGSTYLGGSESSFSMSAGEISENTTDSLSESGDGGGVYVAGGNFTISGGRVSRNEAEQGGGIFILNGACTMENSEIIENTTFSKALLSQGGGVFLGGGSLTMNSGSINGNKAAKGGGLYELGGDFTMKSGQIDGNTAYVLPGQLCNGGGVYWNNGTFRMEGGEIRGNTTSAWNMFNHGGGVFVYGGALQISGDATITGNSRSGVPNNVYLKAEANIIEVAGALTGTNGAIGISTGIAPEGTTSLVVAQGTGGYDMTASDHAIFVRDLGGVLTLSGNTTVLEWPSTSLLTYLSYEANGGSGTCGTVAILEGMSKNITVTSGGVFTRTNCSFAGWNTKADGSGAAYQPDGILTLDENTVLYAQWTIDRTELTVTAPQGGAAPSSSAAFSTGISAAAITWKHGEDSLTGSFDYNTVYAAGITLTAGSGCKFADTPEVLLNGQTAAVQSRSDGQLTVDFTFAKTGPRSTPSAVISQTSYDIANTGGATALSMTVVGICAGYQPVTWTMSKTDGSNILTLPAITTGTLTNGALSLGSVAVVPNTAGHPQKNASVTITFGGNDAGEYAGTPASITVNFRLAAGGGPAAELDYINERITGVTTGMEYLVDGSAGAPSDWTGATSVTGTAIGLGGVIPEAGSSAKYVHIRFAGISDSVTKTIMIPARPDLHDILDWDSWVDHNILYDTELGGVYWDFGYRINNGSDMVNDSGNCLDIKLNPGDKLTFWMPATSSSFKSAEVTVTAPQRIGTPNVAVDYTNETMLNTSDSLQYRLSDGDEWTSCSAIMAPTDFGWNGSGAVSVQFCFPYTDDHYASLVQTLTIPARPVPPFIRYTSTATTVAIVAETGVRYRLGGGEWRTGGEDGKVVFTGLTANQSFTVDAQTTASSAAFQSESTSLSVMTASHGDDTGGLGGVVTRSSSPVQGAAVTLMLGSQQIDDAVTDVYGRYQFNNVPPGIYNLTAAKDSVTKTVKEEIRTAEFAGADIDLPLGRTNSVVEIPAGTPAIVVGNLEKIFEHQDGVVFTSADQTAVNSGGTVEIKITAELVAEDPADSDQNMITGQAPSGEVGLYLDMKLNKSVTTGSGTVDTPLNASNTLLEIVVPLPSELQDKNNYVVYRCHGGAVQTLTAVPNGDGEYITVNAGKTAITIHAKLFSTYAVGYLAQEAPASGGKSSRSSKTVPAKAEGVPYYLDENGSKIFLGFSFDSNGMMQYIAPNGKTVLYGQNTKNFTDIGSHWAKSSIDFITQREIFQGTDKERFSPDAGMTRGMFAAAIGRLYEHSYGIADAPDAATFTDVAAGSYYAVYIDWAERNGIMKGAGGGKFAPDRQITRGEMALALYRFAGFLKLSGTETAGIQLGYSDTSEISTWAVDAAKYCQKANLIAGRGNGRFAAGETATRAEVATILERFIHAVV